MKKRFEWIFGLSGIRPPRVVGNGSLSRADMFWFIGEKQKQMLPVSSPHAKASLYGRPYTSFTFFDIRCIYLT